MGKSCRSLLLALAAAGMQSCADEPVVQPIPFNHRIHTTKQVICENCHEHVTDAPFAGLPKVEVCMGCHGRDIVKNPAAKPYVALVRKHEKEGTEFPWVRLYELPNHVYYSHRRHVDIAKLECKTCHGGIGESEQPPDRPIARTLTMENCMDCHERSGVDNDCAWCHR